MAKLEDVIKAIQDSETHQVRAFENACNNNLYTNDNPGMLSFFADFGVAGLSKPTTPDYVPKTGEAFDFDKLSCKQRQAVVANLYHADYEQSISDAETQKRQEEQTRETAARWAADQEKKKKKSNFLISSGIAGVVFGIGMLVSAAVVPKVSADENYINHQVMSQKVNVEAYKRTHGGRSPSWEKSEVQIRYENTSDYSGFKGFLMLLGALGLLGGAGSAAYGYHKRR